MKKGFGLLHYSALFFEKIMSARSDEPESSLSAMRVAVSLLKGLDELQATNPLVTYSFATDALRVYYRGRMEFHIVAKKHRVVIQAWSGQLDDDCQLVANIMNRPDLFKQEMKPNIQWIFSKEAASWFVDYLTETWKLSEGADAPAEFSHSRHIPGDIRQVILSEFLSSGQWCPGVSGLTKRHKIGSEARIEFDHILPYSLGGSNNFHNVQILCSNCNSLKRATAN